MEKYGFVYLWYDRKRKMYYVGCHWGTTEDGYVCSSTRMRNALRRRPQDFKRRVVKYVYTNRSDLLTEEHRWLSMISDQELGTRYYNLRKHYWGHWSADDEKRKVVGQKLKSIWTEEMRQRAREKTLGDKNPMKRPEVAERVAYKNRGRTPWNKGLDVTNPIIREQGRKLSKSLKGRIAPNKGIPMSEEQKEKLSKTWTITFPDNSTNVIKNLNKFCREHDLTPANMLATARGSRKTHKGFSCMGTV